MANTGKIKNSPNMRSAKMLASEALARRSSGVITEEGKALASLDAAFTSDKGFSELTTWANGHQKMPIVTDQPHPLAQAWAVNASRVKPVALTIMAGSLVHFHRLFFKQPTP